jgi:NifU-like protein involved in Fe-S cluster formation
VKIQSSILAEDAIKAAIGDCKAKHGVAADEHAAAPVRRAD